MAAQGGFWFQEKVNRLLSKQNKRPVLKPNRPLVLKDSVANRKPRKGEAPCVTELSIMMACWKKNTFVDALCSAEMNAFYTCLAKAQAATRNKSEQASAQRGSLPSKEVNVLLKKYPNQSSEI